MRVAKLLGSKELSITEVTPPVSDGKNAIVKVTKVGICGSDLHQWKDGEDFKGLIMGHEFSGVIEDAGSSIDLKPGDRVTVNPVMACGTCDHCKSGNTNLCGDEAIGCNVKYPGAYAEYVACPPENIRKLTASISDIEAAMIEPAAVAYHAVSKLNVQFNDKVLVAGSGIIGLLVASIAKSKGASYVAITDINPARLKAAQDYGVVDGVFNAADETLAKSLQKASGNGFNKFFDCVGIAPSINNGIAALSPKGKGALIGVNFHAAAIETYPLLVKEIELVGINCYTDADFDATIDLISNNEINVEQFVTKNIQLDELQATFQSLDTGKSDDLKIMVSF